MVPNDEFDDKIEDSPEDSYSDSDDAIFDYEIVNEKEYVPERVKNILTTLKETLVSYNPTFNARRLQFYNENNLWGLLQNNENPDSPFTVSGENKSPKEYRDFISTILTSLITQITIEINESKAKYNMLTFLHNELDWAKSALDEFKYPITKDAFGKYQMDKTAETPARYKIDSLWIKALELSEDALHMIEKVYIPKIIEIKFNAVSKYNSFLMNQISIIQTLNIPSISGQELNDDEPIGEKPVINLPDSFNLPKLDLTITKLDKRQTALLFYLFQKNGLILNYSFESLAKILHILTGHSEQNIRTKDGFGIREDILRDYPETKPRKYEDVPNYNLNIVKKALEEIIAMIDAQIKKNLERNVY